MFLVSILFSLSVQAKVVVPHLHPDMDGYEYSQLVSGIKEDQADELQPIMDMGKRNLQWIDAINKTRPEDKKLQLSTPESQIAYPVEAPSTSNRTIVKTAFADLKKELPTELSDVLFSTVTYPTQVSIPDEQLVPLLRKVDRVYQKASRWLLQEPYLFQYSMKITEDVRGYYFLSRDEGFEQNLEQFSVLDKDKKALYMDWLTGICVNTQGNASTCRKKLEAAVANGGTPVAFYNSYIKGAEDLYNSYFQLENPRSDITWNSSNPNVASVKFLTHENPEVVEWLRTNIQDEWKWNTWQLVMDFVTSGTHAYVTFVPGATPNVNGLGGNKITMDANRNIQEYTSRWTIRHEYGHTLGFPDCYVEFYDQAQGMMINYQIDTTNLMCSRRGHIKDTHYVEMEKHYFH